MHGANEIQGPVSKNIIPREERVFERPNLFRNLRNYWPGTRDEDVDVFSRPRRQHGVAVLPRRANPHPPPSELEASSQIPPAPPRPSGWRRLPLSPQSIVEPAQLEPGPIREPTSLIFVARERRGAPSSSNVD